MSTIHALFDKLSQIADEANAEPVCWILGDNFGADYCYSCCRALVKHHNRKVRGHGNKWLVDGGWDERRERDGPAICTSCGKILQYWLTRHGLANEMDHFATALNTIISPHIAYELEAVLLAAEGTDDESPAVRIVEQYMAKCRPLARPHAGGRENG